MNKRGFPAAAGAAAHAAKQASSVRGPLWAVYEADRFGAMMARPLNERFAFCPWGLYNIDVQ